jgi:hypothetical protein
LEKYLPKILYYDSSGYEPEIEIAEEYFDNPEMKHKEKNNESQKETCRELKSDIVIENKKLQLKENKKETEYTKESNIDQDNEGDGKNEIVMNGENKTVDKTKIFVNNYTEVKPSDLKATTDIPETISKTISLEDYEKLSPDELFYDKRTFFATMKDELIQDHPFISLIFKRSLIDPSHIRLINFVFEINMQFAFSAMLFTDDYIAARITNQKAVKKYLK